MTELGWVLVGLPGLVLGYAYAGYPVLLKLLSLGTGPRPVDARDPGEWPRLSVSLPAHDEADTIRGAIEGLLAADYPAERRQIVVVSDASSDATDEIVQEYRDRGVELVRQEPRGGKTAAENAAVPHLRGEIIVNTDASVRVRPSALKALVRHFSNPEVGVVSGRDISVAGTEAEDGSAAGEASYVGYEMWVRSLETRLGGIVGASGCLYAIRRELHEIPVPDHLSRDFCAALTAREHGFRSVSAEDALCEVPRTDSLAREFHRKVRTIVRGLQTLAYKRRLLDPFQYGGFAWKLWSHKLARWMGAALAPLAVLGLVLWSFESVAALAAVGLLAATGTVAVLAYRVSARGRKPRGIVRLLGYVYAANAAAALALWKVLRAEKTAVWEPTRR